MAAAIAVAISPLPAAAATVAISYIVVVFKIHENFCILPFRPAGLPPSSSLRHMRWCVWFDKYTL